MNNNNENNNYKRKTQSIQSLNENSIGKKMNFAKLSKGWHQESPKTKSERLLLLHKCGEDAFLDSKRLKYPIISVNDKSCNKSCKGIVSAIMRAKEWNNIEIYNKAVLTFNSNCK